MSKDIYAHTFELTQGQKSTTVYLHRLPDKTRGLWKSSSPSFAFRDTSDHDQWVWSPYAWVLVAFNDIGLTDTVGQGHVIDFSNADADSRAFDLYGVNMFHPKSGDTGKGYMRYIHSHALNADMFDWEYQALTLVRGWATNV